MAPDSKRIATAMGHRDPALGKREAHGVDRRAHPRSALSHRGGWEPDDVDARQLGADPDLDLDGNAVDTEQRR
jgi:hypothetical protein